ncbi:CAAX amino terminal protease family protein [Melia azedarach]|uniref:CAAX amino terminal protease family protein n=1 Tax=Melia azedarach TaxID=155640 RepID=A0ACC1Z305_MELAZ|nr:CAAX amino terminal protease family protein [Melia azedarach]
MILARCPISSLLQASSAKFGGDFNKLLSPLPLSRNNAVSSIVFPKCRCLKNDITEKPSKGFSVLASDIPWESGSTWSTMAFYIFNLHIPLGYGGLSIVAYILHQPVPDPQTQALSLLVFQILELCGALFLLSRTMKPEHDLVNFFKANKLPKERNWLLASALGFGVLTLLIVLTSLAADRLFGAKAASNPVVKEILLSSDISRTALAIVNCLIAPLLEETIYRGFLLTSLASTMNVQHAVVISSAIFSAAHFSVDNFLQLFIIGCVLGCSYCWSGNLSSSIAIHSLYNALILMITFLS